MRHKQHPQPRIPDSVCVCGVDRNQDRKPKNHVPIPLSSFPGWLVSGSAAQCCPERLAPCFPHHHVLLLRKEMRGNMELMLGTRN